MSLLNKVRANNSKEAQTIGKQCSTNSAAINKTSPSTKQFSVQVSGDYELKMGKRAQSPKEFVELLILVSDKKLPS